MLSLNQQLSRENLEARPQVLACDSSVIGPLSRGKRAFIGIAQILLFMSQVFHYLCMLLECELLIRHRQPGVRWQVCRGLFSGYAAVRGSIRSRRKSPVWKDRRMYTCRRASYDCLNSLLDHVVQASYSSIYIVQYNCLFRVSVESSLRSLVTSNPKRHRHVDADISVKMFRKSNNTILPRARAPVTAALLLWAPNCWLQYIPQALNGSH
jgi:hypothetical protein